MKIFAVHKSQDVELVKKFKEETKAIFGLNFLILENASKIWKIKAKKQIKQADIVIYFAGDTYSDNINWELEIAKKYKVKVLVYRVNENIELAKELYESNYSGELELKFEEVSHAKLIEILKNDNAMLTKKLFNPNINESQSDIVLQQYQMLLSTSETLIERRQRTTNTYLTINSLLLPIITFMLSSSNCWLCISAVAIAVLSIVLCSSWINTLEAYAKSNAAKFEIIEKIESKLPLLIFSSEWVALSNIKSKYSSFTKLEKVVPKVMIIADIILIIISIFVFLFHAGVLSMRLIVI